MNARLLLTDSDRDEIRAKLNADREVYASRLTDVDHIDDREMIATARAALADIDDALIRLNTSEYGYCADCGKWIAIARLRAVPHTRYCIECAAARG